MALHDPVRVQQTIEALRSIGDEYPYSDLLLQREALLLLLGKLRSDFCVLQGAFAWTESQRRELQRGLAEWCAEQRPRFPPPIQEAIKAIEGISGTWVLDCGIRMVNTPDVVEGNTYCWDLLVAYEVLVRRVLLEQARAQTSLLQQAPTLDTVAKGEAAAAGVEATQTRAANLFERRGKSWLVRFHGTETNLEDGPGPRYVAYLLRRPGVSVDARELRAAIAASHSEAPARDHASDGVDGEADSGTGQELADPRTRRDVRRQLVAIAAKREAAKARNDLPAQQACDEEAEQLEAYLNSTTGAAGRPRSFASDRERARKSVLARIEDVRRPLKRDLPDLWQHFRIALRTGAHCSYNPPEPVEWQL